eukprot:5139040-Amphidinium_carterae.1
MDLPGQQLCRGDRLEPSPWMIFTWRNHVTPKHYFGGRLIHHHLSLVLELVGHWCLAVFQQVFHLMASAMVKCEVLGIVLLWEKI